MPVPMSDSPALTPALRRSILLLSLSNFSSMSVQRICDAMLPALAQEFSVSLAQAAQVVSFFAIAYGAALLFYGPIGDRVGKFALIAFCTLACSIGSVVSALAPDLSTLVLGRVLVALAAAAMIPMGLAWVGDAVSYDKRQETLALLGLGSTLGLVSGQLLGGLFTDWFGWRWAFWFLTALFGVVGALQWRDWRQQRVQPHHMAGLAGAPATRQRFGAQLLVILRRPHARAVLLTSVAQGALAWVGGVLYMVGARRLIPRLGERGLVLTGAAALSIGACGLAFTPYALLAPVASLVAGFGLFMMQNTLQTNATQMAPERRGAAVSSFACCFFLGQAIGVWLAGLSVAEHGTRPLMVAGALGTLAVGAAFGRLRARQSARAVAAAA
jgi:predicted MFS family arabinose efflux permease